LRERFGRWARIFGSVRGRLVLGQHILRGGMKGDVVTSRSGGVLSPVGVETGMGTIVIGRSVGLMGSVGDEVILDDLLELWIAHSF